MFLYFMLFEFLCFLEYLIFYDFLEGCVLFFVVVNVVTHFYFTDVGHVFLEGLSRHVHVVLDEEQVILEVDVALHGVERNLTILTIDVPMTYVKDMPLRMERNIVGLPQP